jgi:hypothetical protein
MAAATTAPQNLSPSVQGSMLRGAVVAFAVALLTTMLVVGIGLPWATRALLFVPYMIASYMLHAALLGRCFMTSLRGCRMTCNGREEIGDPEERKELRRLGSRAFMSTLGVATAATALAILAH